MLQRNGMEWKSNLKQRMCVCVCFVWIEKEFEYASVTGISKPISIVLHQRRNENLRPYRNSKWKGVTGWYKIDRFCQQIICVVKMFVAQSKWMQWKYFTYLRNRRKWQKSWNLMSQSGGKVEITSYKIATLWKT